jgi:hypothetical protein
MCRQGGRWTPDHLKRCGPPKRFEASRYVPRMGRLAPAFPARVQPVKTVTLPEADPEIRQAPRQMRRPQ